MNKIQIDYMKTVKQKLVKELEKLRFLIDNASLEQWEKESVELRKTMEGLSRESALELLRACNVEEKIIDLKIKWAPYPCQVLQAERLRRLSVLHRWYQQFENPSIESGGLVVRSPVRQACGIKNAMGPADLSSA